MINFYPPVIISLAIMVIKTYIVNSVQHMYLLTISRKSAFPCFVKIIHVDFNKTVIEFIVALFDNRESKQCPFFTKNRENKAFETAGCRGKFFLR